MINVHLILVCKIFTLMFLFLIKYRTFYYIFSGKVTLQELYTVQAIQLNKLVLNKKEEQNLVKFFKDKMSHETFCLHLTLLKTFYFSSKDALIYMVFDDLRDR